MSPLTAPAITAEVAAIFPTITEPAPILAVPVVETSPSILALSAKNSDETLLPFTTPVMVNLPLHLTLPTMVPSTSIDPVDSKSPVIFIPFVIIAFSSDTALFS